MYMRNMSIVRKRKMIDKAEKERRDLNQKLIERTLVNQMKNTFSVSLCKNGLLGGFITVGDVSMVYKTGKVSVPQKYRNLVMAYSDVVSVTEGWLLFLSTVTVKMKDEEEYKFVVFNMKRFMNMLSEKRSGR